MPHFIIEYSANLEQQISVDDVISRVHAAAAETGIFPLKGTRTRAARREAYQIADGHPDNLFVHLQARIGAGRSLDVKQQAAQHIFEALTAVLEPVSARAPLAISFEVVEMDEALNFKHNNIPEWLEKRKSG